MGAGREGRGATALRILEAITCHDSGARLADGRDVIAGGYLLCACTSLCPVLMEPPLPEHLRQPRSRRVWKREGVRHARTRQRYGISDGGTDAKELRSGWLKAEGKRPLQTWQTTHTHAACEVVALFAVFPVPACSRAWRSRRRPVHFFRRGKVRALVRGSKGRRGSALHLQPTTKAK